MPEGEDLVLQEQIGDGTHGQEGAEGNPGLAAPALPDHCRDADQTAGQGTEENNVGQALPAEESADHGEQLDVATTHAFPPGQGVVAEGHGVQQATAQENAQTGLLPADQVIAERPGKTEHDARQADHVGDYLMMDIDKYDNQQRSDKHEVVPGGQAEAKARDQGRRQGGHGHFHQRVLRRDAHLAGPAATAQGEVAEHRDILVPMQRPPAARAMRSREHDRLAFAGQAKDDHIQKRADNGSENSGKTDQQWFHLA